MMRAVQLSAPGAASQLKLVDLPIPVPKDGQVLIRVKAFGLNRSELLTRKFGRAPVGPVQLPRVLGIEATGVVEDAPGSEAEFPKGAVVLTAVGGMGIMFDGGYAQYTCVSKANAQVLKTPTKLEWSVLGALPEMLQTAHGTLFRGLKLQKGDRLLIRGGTSSVGLAAAAIAKAAGATVLTTTRRTDDETAKKLRENGAEHVVIDDGSVAKKLFSLYPSGVEKVLELVGGSTTVDSLSCLAVDGILCFCGLVGGSASIADFAPLALIQTQRYLTAYGERSFSPSNLPLDELVQQIEEGTLNVPIGRVFQMDQIVAAHELLENNEAFGKIVVLTGM